MTSTKKLRASLAGLLLVSFGVLLFLGGEIHRQAPPMPETVVTTDGSIVFTRADIEQGRQVWQSIGGHQLGSIWRHGGYVAPDWTADWLHREALATMDLWAARQMRVPGDVLFSIGALLLAWFVFRLWVSPRKARTVLPEGAKTTQH